MAPLTRQGLLRGLGTLFTGDLPDRMRNVRVSEAPIVVASAVVLSPLTSAGAVILSPVTPATNRNWRWINFLTQTGRGKGLLLLLAVAFLTHLAWFSMGTGQHGLAQPESCKFAYLVGRGAVD